MQAKSCARIRTLLMLQRLSEALTKDVNPAASLPEEQWVLAQTQTQTQTQIQTPAIEPAPYYSVMKNIGNGTFYTVTMCFGKSFSGSEMCLPGIPDTGSFELVVRSSRCKKCGEPFYNDSNSSTFDAHVTKHNHTQLMYGSGPVKALWVSDDVRVQGTHDSNMENAWWKFNIFGGNSGGIEVPRQRFLESLGTPISDFQKGDKLCGIYGIGRGLKKGRETRFVARAGVKRYSICLPRDEKKDGLLVWSSPDVKDNVNYTAINVEGQFHWAVKASHIRLQHTSSTHEGIVNSGVDSIVKKTGQSNRLSHLQDSTACAILDSGTTLIAPTTMMALKMQAYVQANPLNCDDISHMPTLKFKLDGKDFELPPEAYVAKLEDDDSNKTDLGHKLAHPSFITDRCMLLLTRPMDMEQPNSKCPLMIFGMPFFRFYKTTFDWYANRTDGKDTNNTGMVYTTEHSDCVDGKNSWNQNASKYQSGSEQKTGKVFKAKSHLITVNPKHLKFPKMPAHYFQHGKL